MLCIKNSSIGSEDDLLPIEAPPTASQCARLLHAFSNPARRKFSRRFALYCLLQLLWVCPITATGANVFTTLITFTDTNGAYPFSTLIYANDGYFYGTTTGGGSNPSGGYGTIFKMDSDGTLVWSVSLNGTNGDTPYSGVIQGTDGNLYGTTDWGGTNGGNGTVFKITPAGTLTSLYSFTGGFDGFYPNGGLTQASDGNFYGTTYYGGTNNQGTVFKITPTGTFTPLYSFAGADGLMPFAGLVQARNGALYGTTQFGGTNNSLGTIFKITTNGVLTVIHHFANTGDGAGPTASLIQGTDGALYGTSAGARQPTATYGTIFKLTPQDTLVTLYTFSGSEGSQPNGLLQATDGNFYGTTQYGSWQAYGIIFVMTPAGVLTTLHTFASVRSADGTFIDGAEPCGGVAQGNNGNLYGTTSAGPRH